MFQAIVLCASGRSASLPLWSDDFDALFHILNGNLRSLLSSSDAYCAWVADRLAPDEVQVLDEGRKRALYKDWLEETSRNYLQAVRDTCNHDHGRCFSGR